MGELATEKHVKYILSVEKVRFPFMDLMYFSDFEMAKITVVVFKIAMKHVFNHSIDFHTRGIVLNLLKMILTISKSLPNVTLVAHIFDRFVSRERMIFNPW